MTSFRSHSRKAALVAAVAALGALSALPTGAQALIHRYSFNGNANDSAGSANGVAVGNVTFATAPGVNGSATFAGGTTTSSPGYVSLPASAVSGLQNATVEIFTTNFNMPKDAAGLPGGAFQSLFSVASAAPSAANYVVLCANRAGSGLGTGAGTNGASQVLAAQDPLPVSIANHVVDLVYSGFTGIGSTGTETIYVDGVQVAQSPTVFSFADVAAGAGGIGVVGIGGGSPFNDPTFSGSMNEVRIFSDALTPAQVAADVAAGPGVAPASSTSLSVGSIRGSVGQTVTLAATLMSTVPRVLPNNKTLTFLVDGSTVGTAVTDGSGRASWSYALPAGMAPGSHVLSVSFAGDGSLSAASATGTLLVIANTVLSVPSFSGAYGQTIQLSATLQSAAAGVAGKTLTFKAAGTTLGTAVTGPTGIASLGYVVPNTLVLGAHPVSVAFADNGGYLGSLGAGTLTVAKAGTDLTLPALSGAHGATVTLTATLRRATDRAALANRAVTFTMDGKAAGMAVTNASGVASRSYTVPSGSVVGGHPVSASYAGDGTSLMGTGSGTLTITR